MDIHTDTRSFRHQFTYALSLRHVSFWSCSLENSCAWYSSIHAASYSASTMKSISWWWTKRSGKVNTLSRNLTHFTRFTHKNQQVLVDDPCIVWHNWNCSAFHSIAGHQPGSPPNATRRQYSNNCGIDRSRSWEEALRSPLPWYQSRHRRDCYCWYSCIERHSAR